MTNREAIKILTKVKALPCGWCYEGGDEYQQALMLSIKALEEQPTGEWEIVDAEGGKIWNCVCTECGHDPQEYIGGTENWWLRKPLPNFCPNCGVKIVNVKGGETNEQ